MRWRCGFLGSEYLYRRAEYPTLTAVHGTFRQFLEGSKRRDLGLWIGRYCRGYMRRSVGAVVAALPATLRAIALYVAVSAKQIRMSGEDMGEEVAGMS